MKKIILVLLTFVALLTLGSCSNDTSSSESKVSSTSVVSVVESTEKSTEKSTESSTVDSTEESSSIIIEHETFTLTSSDASFEYGAVTNVTVDEVDFEYSTAQNASKDEVDYIGLGIEKTSALGDVRPSGYLETKTAIETMSIVNVRELHNSSWTGAIKFEVSLDGVTFTTVEATTRVEVGDGEGSNPQRINYSYNVEGFKYFRVSQTADKFGKDYSVYIEKIEILY